MNEPTAEITGDVKDFSDPAKLKLFFEDMDDVIANLSGRITGISADNTALRTALMAMLTALDDTMPAIRDIVVHALDEEIEKTESGFMPDSAKEAEFDALIELRESVFWANKLIARE